MTWVDVPCDLCGATRSRVRYGRVEGAPAPLETGYRITEHDVRPPPRVVECLSCGLVYATPQPDPTTLEALYAAFEDPDYAAEEAGRRASARRILRAGHRYQAPPGRLLDLGCACGFLLDEARRLGWGVEGIERSHWAATVARTRFGLTVHEGAVDRVPLPPGQFDAITLIDLIEHLPQPKAVLVAARRLLTPHGVLCVNTPDIDSVASRLLRARWWGVQEAHLVYFSTKTLTRILEASGFTVLAVRRHARTFSWRYWASRLTHSSLVGAPGLARLADHLRWRDQLLTLNLGDQIEILARRARQLAFLNEWEAPATPPPAPPALKVVVVLPAYNAARTLRQTVRDIPPGVADEVILVDDASRDDTVAVATQLGLTIVRHPRNRGYGANQKTCFTTALAHGADLVVMVHPDYQYDPTVIPQLIAPIREGRADAVFGSRMMKGGALEGGMPLWKHNANILLTALMNVAFHTYLTEYHSGFRAYSARALRAIRFEENSDNFVFDTEIIVQLLAAGSRLEEIPIRTRYFDEASSIRFWPAVWYGLGILWAVARACVHRWDWRQRWLTPRGTSR